MSKYKSQRFHDTFVTEKQQRPVETVEDFKLRIAAIIHSKAEEIPSPRRSNPILVRPKKQPKAKRRTTSR